MHVAKLEVRLIASCAYIDSISKSNTCRRHDKESGLYGTETVSYTHLDVYKRQK